MTDRDTTAEHPVDRLGTLLVGDPLTRRPGRLQRFDVLAGTVTVPAMLWSGDQTAGRLLIAFNGAVRRQEDKDPAEVFQRRTWVDEISADVLFLADPTLRSDNQITIGWGQGSGTGYAIPALAQAAFYVAAALDVPSRSRLYYGSSAGGFQALQVAARDEGASSLVNIAQIDWTLYMPQNVRTICHSTYDGKPAAEISEEFPDRTSVAHAFAAFGHVPTTRYLVNAASGNDANAQLPALIKGMRTAVGRAPSPRVDVAVYVDQAGGHNPLSKPKTILEINRVLDQLEVNSDE
jgi:hypothetical protein